jgi:hypothetical protein
MTENPDHLSALERLAALRAGGALDEEEFLREKRRLLAGDAIPAGGGRARALAAAFALVVLGGTALAFTLLRHPAGDARPLAQPARTAPAATAAAPAGRPATGQPVLGSYEWATSQAVIDLNPAYLIARLGIPRHRSAHELEYQIGECEVSYATEGTKVTSFTALIDAKCHPDGLTERTTFGELIGEWGARFFADCVGSCGNAHDHYIALYDEGGHAQDYVSRLYSSVELDGAKGDPQGEWEHAIRRQHGLGDDDVVLDDRLLNCVTDPPASVVAELRTARIEAVQVGRNLHPERCAS